MRTERRQLSLVPTYPGPVHGLVPQSLERDIFQRVSPQGRAQQIGSQHAVEESCPTTSTNGSEPQDFLEVMTNELYFWVGYPLIERADDGLSQTLTSEVGKDRSFIGIAHCHTDWISQIDNSHRQLRPETLGLADPLLS